MAKRSLSSSPVRRPEYVKDLQNLTVLRRKLVDRLMSGGLEDATIPQQLNANMNVYKMLALEIDLLEEIEGEQAHAAGSAVKKYERFFAAQQPSPNASSRSESRTRPSPRLVSSNDDDDPSGDSGVDTDA